MRRTAVALVFVLGGCAFAQRHPTITSGIVGAVVGFGGCELDQTKASTCAIIGGSTGVFLGGIVGLVTLFADTSAHELPPDYEPDMHPDAIRVRTSTPPPPAVNDAGVDAASDARDAMTSDATSHD